MTEMSDAEDVNDFLEKIRELGDQRDREDEERNRKLEEEILQGRKDREARRAERARSLSPSKSNTGTPHSVSTSMQDPSISPGHTPQLLPTSQQRVYDNSRASEDMPTPPNLEMYPAKTDIAASPPKPPENPLKSASAATLPIRSNTLSWQQRPSSRDSATGRSRPLSMVATENSAARSPRTVAEPATVNNATASRSDIMQSLGSKDPSFFKQTEDRGYGSAAFRRNPVDDVPKNPMPFGTMQLPGMSRGISTEPEKSPSLLGSVRSPLPFLEHSVQANPGFTDRPSNSTSLSSTASIRSPLPTASSQHFEPPSFDLSASHNGGNGLTTRFTAMSLSQGPVSPERAERPASPTKGLGGFVQSAMLKRSDSVNKRWSAQPGPGLSRGNSIASNRSGYDGSLAAMGGLGISKDVRRNSSRETSPVSSSRPGSSHSNLTVTQAPGDLGRPMSSEDSNVRADERPNDIFVKPAPPLRREGHSFSEIQGVTEKAKLNDKSPPTSPSKRWSPSKSSWLENAINKPDSPKPKAAAPQQPIWLSELNKAKQQRGSIDVGKPKDFKEVETNGLLRSPPMGSITKSPSFSGFPNSGGTSRLSDPRINSLSASSPTQAFVEIQDTKVAEPKTYLGSPMKDVAALEENLGCDDPSPNEYVTLERASKPAPEKPAEKYSPSVKTKPETPPKKDFTSSLRPRKVSGAKETKDEPEFRNVFGKLKRTQTQNYKAPDELKDNIMRGKAGLSASGGPKPSERRDEFKESILKKREGMKAGLPSASTTIRSASSLAKDQGTPLPEAIAKRQGLTRSGSNFSNATSGHKPPAMNASKGAEVEPEGLPPKKAFSEPTKIQQESVANGKLGGNFNAALAGIISRGPSPMASGSDTGPIMAPDANASEHPSPMDPALSTSKGSSQLSHMTKGRARGPKRRLPTNVEQSSGSTLPTETPQREEPEAPAPNYNTDLSVKARQQVLPVKGPQPRPLTNISNNDRRVSQPASPRKPSTSVSVADDVKQAFQKSVTKEIDTVEASPQAKQKPASTPDKTKPRKPSASIAQPPTAKSPEPHDIHRPLQTPSSVQSAEPIHPDKDRSESSLKDSIAKWQRPPSTPRNSVKTPIRLPTHKDEDAAREQVDLAIAPSKELIGLGIETVNSKPRAPATSVRNLPASPAPSPKSPKSPPLPAKKPVSIASRVSSANLTPQLPPWKSQTSLSPNSEASRVLTDFFGASPICNTKFNIKTQSIISSRSTYDGSDKIKTLRKQIFEVAGDGKLLPVPSHQEHILFEESLYLCTHIFGNVTGTRTTEVYLWCGDAVTTSAVEDAQLFCRKVARDNNGKLIILRQGKETANFFQALGGIVVTRRGSSAKAGSAATYMLCGRRHVGQIAFDEVDLTYSSLCKGFPYIVCAPSGKLFLWKGAGSGADELGCAKLIGMDISLTGEIEEIEDGRESAAFWEAFPGGKQGLPDAATTKHWQLKASYEKYATRLFSVEVEASRPKSSSSFLWGRRGSAPTNEEEGTMTAVISEVVPFAQADLDSNEGIRVLDAFFEVHVLVPSTSRALLPTFRAACEFAQEYGILVASAEDRPFVPVSRVVLGRSVPNGVKRAFRKWVDTPYERMECVVLPLNESLRATQPA